MLRDTSHEASKLKPGRAGPAELRRLNPSMPSPEIRYFHIFQGLGGGIISIAIGYLWRCLSIEFFSEESVGKVVVTLLAGQRRTVCLEQIIINVALCVPLSWNA